MQTTELSPIQTRLLQETAAAFKAAGEEGMVRGRSHDFGRMCVGHRMWALARRAGRCDLDTPRIITNYAEQETGQDLVTWNDDYGFDATCVALEAMVIAAGEDFRVTTKTKEEPCIV